MSSGNINNKNIFSSLDSITKSLDLMSDRLGKLEKNCLDSRADNTVGLHLFPGIIERITTAPDLDGVLNELLETLTLTMDRGLVLSLKEGRYIPLSSKGYDQMPEENPEPADAPDDLLMSAVKSRQILIIKGNIGDKVSFAFKEDAGTRYCMFIPIVFGDQVPLVYYGESAKSPDPDLAESVINIAALVIKNQHLAAMLRTSSVEKSSDMPEHTDTETASPSETGYEKLSSHPGRDSEPEESLYDDSKKVFHSVDDFDTDVISAEELIRSFNIDINRKIPDLEEETEDFLNIAGSAGEEAADIEEAVEENQGTWTESAGLEIEIPVEEYPVAEEDSEAKEKPEEEEEEAIPPAESEPHPGDRITEKDAAEAAEEFEEASSFARLLVSEIKLYNEGSVIEGRKNGDLYSRLKEQIDLSREVYEARISEEVRTEKDYFGEELVRILANGNTKLLDT